MPPTLSRLETIKGDSSPRPPGLRAWTGASLGLAAVGLLSGAAGPALAGPMACTTSLEAPIMATRDASGSLAIPASPVEVTRCVPVETVPQLMERRAYSWTAPYAPGIDLMHQVTSILGIATGGLDGRRVMGFGFPDQTLVWDATAIHNTTYALLDLQSNPMPQRTADLVSVFNTSLGSGGGLAQPPNPEEGGLPSVYLNPPQMLSAPSGSSRGLW